MLLTVKDVFVGKNSSKPSNSYQHSSSFPLELVCIDYLSLGSCKDEIKDILVVTDHFTKYAKAYPTKGQQATTVPKILHDNFFMHYGFPAKLHSDQG